MGESGSIWSSPDGATWTDKSSGTTNTLTSVIHANEQYVAVGFGGTILTSPDGTTWAIRNSGTTKYLASVSYGNNRFVAVGDSGTVVSAIADNVGVIQTNMNKVYNRNTKVTIMTNSISAVIPTNSSLSQATVNIFSGSGKQIYSSTSKIVNNALSIPSIGFPNGLYYLTI